MACLAMHCSTQNFRGCSYLQTHIICMYVATCGIHLNVGADHENMILRLTHLLRLVAGPHLSAGHNCSSQEVSRKSAGGQACAQASNRCVEFRNLS